MQDLALEHELAIGFGILTVENEAQALARAAIGKRNKGGEAARACLAMIALKRRFGLVRAMSADGRADPAGVGAAPRGSPRCRRSTRSS